ncbi:DUF2593 family protein [Affinibrenneria salicis]|uniref:DUF2593 family protein n=2 Tax=Affinibrenneria salicis TaxID=2590031 RepID=A0A5J5G3Z6_9GAMM|nr:DUF2593 family protein [Affinibrenneria salicis]
MVAGTAIVATRLLGLFLLASELGVDGLRIWLLGATASWDTTLVLLTAVCLIGAEIRCGFAVIRGLNWGRWGYVACQLAASLYLLLVSLGVVALDLFQIDGDSGAQVVHQLVLQKIPDVLVVLLLFLPRRSRRFFLRRK